MTSTTTTDAGPPIAPVPASTSEHDDARLGTISLALAVAGLLPVLPVLGSIAAIACGWIADRGSPTERRRGQVGIVLGVVGLAAPFVALFVYCVVLGYPFPIHRYRG